MIPDYWHFFCSICEIAFLFAIVIVHFLPYDFTEKKMKPFFQKHQWVAIIFVAMSCVGFLYFMYRMIITM